MAAEWRGLNEAQKQPYILESEANKARYSE